MGCFSKWYHSLCGIVWRKARCKQGKPQEDFLKGSAAKYAEVPLDKHIEARYTIDRASIYRGKNREDDYGQQAQANLRSHDGNRILYSVLSANAPARLRNQPAGAPDDRRHTDHQRRNHVWHPLQNGAGRSYRLSAGRRKPKALWLDRLGAGGSGAGTQTH